MRSGGARRPGASFASAMESSPPSPTASPPPGGCRGRGTRDEPGLAPPAGATEPQPRSAGGAVLLVRGRRRRGRAGLLRVSRDRRRARRPRARVPGGRHPGRRGAAADLPRQVLGGRKTGLLRGGATGGAARGAGGVPEDERPRPRRLEIRGPLFRIAPPPPLRGAR